MVSVHRWVGSHVKVTSDDLREEEDLGTFFFLAEDLSCRAHVLVGFTQFGLLAIPLRFGEQIGEPIEVISSSIEVPRSHQWRFRDHTFSCQWEEIRGKYPRIAALYPEGGK